MGLLDLSNGGFFGFVGDGEASEIGERRELLFLTLGEEVAGETGVVGLHGGLDDGVIGLISLDDNISYIKVAASDASDDLGKEFKTALFGGKIGESKPRIGLDNADGGEVGQIESAGEGLCADENVNFARFDGLIEVSKVSVFFVVAVETGDFGIGEEAAELRFEEFGAKTLVDDVGVLTIRAA